MTRERTATGPRLRGKVKWFDAKKGFGFIEREDGEGDLFVHHSDVDMPGFRQLEQDQAVEFRIAAGKKGPKAAEVKILEA